MEEIGPRADTGALLGDPSKAKEKLGWTPTTTLEQLVAEMVAADKEEAAKEPCCAAGALRWWVPWRIHPPMLLRWQPPNHDLPDHPG